MARPKVFVSSTYYDLKHIRASLDRFIDSLGYESVLSEKGNIAYFHDKALDQSCYKEVESADLFVLIIGGRYGSKSSSYKSNNETLDSTQQKYDSVTKAEFDSAIRGDIPIFILIESAVMSEYRTYQENKDHTSIKYAHVDSKNVFVFIEHVLKFERNNPYHTFDKVSDIENWLKEQWAGLFKNFLNRSSGQKELAKLEIKIEELGEINKTLSRYIESIIQVIDPSNSKEIIEEENERLKNITTANELKNNQLVKYLIRKFDMKIEDIINIANKSKKLDEFMEAIFEINPEKTENDPLYRKRLSENIRFLEDVNTLRKILNLEIFPIPENLSNQ